MSEATVDVADLRRADSSDAADRADDAPLRDDIRLLGRVLGEVIGEQAGADVLDLVESTRVEAFKIRRSEVDRAELAERLAGLDIRSANHVIRAFSHFSLLANLAEDIHHERRRRFHRREGSPPQKGSLAATFQLLDEADLPADVVARELAGALVCPVVTAHPTEVRRKTISDVQRQVTELIRQRDRTAVGEGDDAEWSAQLWRSVLTLWQTALLRLSRLRLTDEIDEALRYYELSLFDVVPALNAELRRALNERWPDAGLLPRPMLLPGSWIGGDRDGNPFVTADALRRATTRQAETALGHHLAELDALRDELSMSDRLVTPTPELYHLAEASRDDSPFRADEPYRRALNGIAARLAATATTVLGRVVPGPDLHVGAAALRLARTSCAPTSTSSTPRCAATARGRWPTTGCSGCARRWRSSASTCAGWTCGRTPPSTSRSWASCWRGPGCATTTRRSTRPPGWSCWPAS